MLTPRRALLLTMKDLRIFFGNWFTVAFAFAFPLVFVVAFSLFLPAADPEELSDIYLATEEGEGGISRTIIDGLTAGDESPFIELDPSDANRQADDGDIDGYILFPADFSASVATPGGSTQILVITDDTDPNAKAILQGVAGGIADEIALRQATVVTAITLIATNGGDLEAPELQQAIQESFTPGDSSESQVTIVRQQAGDVDSVPAVNYVLTGYITMFLFFAAGFGAGELIKERDNYTLDRLIASGVSPGTILGGKWLGTATRAVLQAIVLWGAGVLIFSVSLGKSPLAVMLVTLAMIVASASFTLFLASIAKTQQSADSATVLASLSFAALGGSWWPLFIEPEWMQSLAKFTPQAWANEAFNDLLLFGATLDEVLTNILVLLGFGVVFATLAAVRMRVRG